MLVHQRGNHLSPQKKSGVSDLIVPSQGHCRRVAVHCLPNWPADLIRVVPCLGQSYMGTLIL